MSWQYSPWEAKQNRRKTPPHTNILKTQPWQMRSQLILFFQVTENLLGVEWILWNVAGLSGSSLDTLKPYLPSHLEQEVSNFSPVQANLTRMAEWKPRCSFIDASECWLGFYRYFSHDNKSHYKNCKIKGKLQIHCWVFITELIRMQRKQKLPCGERPHCASRTSSVDLKAWLTSGLGQVSMV